MERTPHGNRLRELKRQQWALGVACAAIVAVLWSMGIMDRLELPTLDWRTRWFNRWAGGAAPGVVVIGIDDRALEEVGRWPWKRDVLAEVVDELAGAGVETIALDVTLDSPPDAPTELEVVGSDGVSEADRRLVEVLTERGRVVMPMRTRLGEGGVPLVVEVERRRAGLEGLSDDAAAPIIAARIESARRGEGGAAVGAEEVAAVLPTVRALESMRQRGSVEMPDSSPWTSRLVRVEGVTFPIPVLMERAAAIGDVGIGGFDADWVFRRFPLWMSIGDGRLWPAFSLAAVAQYLDVQVSDLRVDEWETRLPATQKGEEPRRIPTATRAVGGPVRALIYDLTWPRGGSKWLGQFGGGGGDGKEAREVSIVAVLEPLLIRRAVGANLATLERLVELAGKLNLGDFGAGVEAVRALRGVRLEDEGWGAAFERAAPEAARAAREAKGFLEFAGEVDVAELSPEDARTFLLHRGVAEKIPVILEGCRGAREQIDASRVRLRSIVAGKLCFVGWTATGVVADAVNTGLGAKTPGVYVHAAAASGILSGFNRTRVPLGVDVVFIGVLGLGGIAAARRASVWLAVVLLVALLAGWLLLAGVVFWDAMWRVVSVSGPTVALAGSWLVVVLHRLLVEQRLRRRTEERFRAYVAPAIVDVLVNNPALDSMTPQRRELSIMFCDVTGFTAIAERLGAEGTARFLSGYLGRMTQTLLKHGATIDKYLGDGIMAFWGAPVQDPRHARNACRAVLAIARAVSEMEEGRGEAADGSGEPLRIRIGLAAGEVMVGDFGNPPVRSSYTVLGDACNIAARLERAGKMLGTTILASARVREEAGEGFLWRPLGRFILQGRLSPESVYELVGMTSPGARAAVDEGVTLSPALRHAGVGVDVVGAWIHATTEAVEAFGAGRLEESRERFVAMEAEYGPDPAGRVYLREIERRLGGGAAASAEQPDAIAVGEG